LNSTHLKPCSHFVCQNKTKRLLIVFWGEGDWRGIIFFAQEAVLSQTKWIKTRHILNYYTPAHISIFNFTPTLHYTFLGRQKHCLHLLSSFFVFFYHDIFWKSPSIKNKIILLYIKWVQILSYKCIEWSQIKTFIIIHTHLF